MIFTAVYLSAHFFVYALFLRNRPAFYREKNIFLYHAISFLIFATAGGILIAAKSGVFKWVVGAVSLHGIYSVSFLEFWALSDGGYSLRILDRMDSGGTSADLAFLETLGASKKKFRLDSLKRLGLVAPHGGDRWALTPRGFTAAFFFSFFTWVSEKKGGR